MSANEQNWVKLASFSSIPPREGRCIEIAGRQVAVFHTGEGFLAVEHRCPHRGGPLADGIVNGATVVCPLHAWKFDLRSGVSTNHPESSVTLTTYPTRSEDGILYIDLPQRAAAEAAEVACEHRDRPIRWVQRKVSPSLRSGNPDNAGASLEERPPQIESAQGNGYVPQEF